MRCLILSPQKGREEEIIPTVRVCCEIQAAQKALQEGSPRQGMKRGPGRTWLSHTSHPEPLGTQFRTFSLFLSNACLYSRAVNIRRPFGRDSGLWFASCYQLTVCLWASYVTSLNKGSTGLMDGGIFPLRSSREFVCRRLLSLHQVCVHLVVQDSCPH